jgi:hypothetical protein
MVVLFCFAVHGRVQGQEESRGDWRVTLLKKLQIPMDEKSLEQRAAKMNQQVADFGSLVTLLGADRHADRKRAQKEMLLLGRDALPRLRALPDPDDPEVRLRLRQIEKQLEEGQRWDEAELLRVAVEGLLLEKKRPGAPHVSRRMYVECFDKPAASLLRGYGIMKFAGMGKLDGSVEEGKVVFVNKAPRVEGDHRLSLYAKDVAGKPQFSGRLRLSVKVSGNEGGEGLHHVGISVGNVRVLYHPGYGEGAFRFQRVDNALPITQNQNMGFTPEVGEWQHVSLEVEARADGTATMNVTVRQQKQVFQSSRVLTADQVVKLNRISLERSGNPGGSAYFDDLIVEWDP